MGNSQYSHIESQDYSLNNMHVSFNTNVMFIHNENISLVYNIHGKYIESFSIKIDEPHVYHIDNKKIQFNDTIVWRMSPTKNICCSFGNTNNVVNLRFSVENWNKNLYEKYDDFYIALDEFTTNHFDEIGRKCVEIHTLITYLINKYINR